MAKFPVELNDDEGQSDAINYLLSGPSGLGQNFSGFSSYTPAYLTGNFRIPYSQPTNAELYVAPIDVDTTEMLDARTIKITFVSAQASAPFSLGNGLSVDSLGLDYDAYISDYGTQIGVVECTTTYVIIRLRKNLPQLDPSTGGTVTFYSTGGFDNSTDCNARVVVNGVTDRVFITSQLDNVISYTVLGEATGTFYYNVKVNRYRGVLNNDPVNPDYTFDFDTTVAAKEYTFTDLSGTGTLPLVETVFATIIDKPLINTEWTGYYLYILEVSFDWDRELDKIQATESLMKLRCLSAQVVKE